MSCDGALVNVRFLQMPSIGGIQMSRDEYVRHLLALPDVADGAYVASGSGPRFRLTPTSPDERTTKYYTVHTHERSTVFGMPFSRKTITKVQNGVVIVLQDGLNQFM